MTRPSPRPFPERLREILLPPPMHPDFPSLSIAEARAEAAAQARAAGALRERRRRRACRALLASALCAVALPWTAGPLAGPSAGAARAQASVPATTPDAGPDAFTSENAILDTAIPFAIGARQAEQALRGSFGWPTFQEGVVEGVYFRFDPDGYARFAPTPRLDSDVFEVICKPRTRTCVGRKGPLTVLLTARGQIQLQLEDTRPGDRFFVAEGVTEIELPPSILQPLEPQMELLLAAGGELVVRRGNTEAERISLMGFYPVSAYLRWVAAGQDYSVLPRGWPVPSSVPSDSITRPATWASPMPQPQSWPTQAIPESGAEATVVPTGAPAFPPGDSATDPAREVAEVRGELRALRELLLRQTVAGQAPAETAGQSAPGAADPELAARIAELQAAAERIQADLARLAPQAPVAPAGAAIVSPQPDLPPHSDLAAAAAALGLVPSPAPLAATAPPVTAGQPAGPQPGAQPMPASPGAALGLSASGLAASAPPVSQPGSLQPGAAASVQPEDERARLAKRLDYLITEIGLDPRTALAILESATPGTAAPPRQPQEQRAGLYRDEEVQKILDELDAGGAPALEESPDYKKIAEFLKNTLD